MKIGFIGLGIMGKPMARNLLRAGYSLVVHNRSRSPVDELVSEGAEEALSAREVAERVPIIITMLPDSPQVEEVVLGNGGILEGSNEPEFILIDMSSIAPLVAQKLEKRVREKGGHMLDAPVSGGEPGAIAGTLAEECPEVQRCLSRSPAPRDMRGKIHISVRQKSQAVFTVRSLYRRPAE